MKKDGGMLPGQRLYYAATVVLIGAIAFGLVCDVLHLQFPVSYPCILNTHFHFYCPGCGGTRAMYALFRLEWIRSLAYNPIVLYAAFLFLYYYIGTTLAVLQHGKKVYFRLNKWMLVTFLLLLLWTMIIRNILAIRFGIDPLGDVAMYWVS